MEFSDADSGPSKDPDEDYGDESEELGEGWPTRAELEAMLPEERARIKKEIEFIKWKRQAPVIQPIVNSDASEDSEGD